MQHTTYISAMPPPEVEHIHLSYSTHGAPIKLHRTAYTVGSTPQHHHSSDVGSNVMFGAAVCHVQVVCFSRVLGSECVDLFAERDDAHLETSSTNLHRRGAIISKCIQAILLVNSSFESSYHNVGGACISSNLQIRETSPLDHFHLFRGDLIQTDDNDSKISSPIVVSKGERRPSSRAG